MGELSGQRFNQGSIVFEYLIYLSRINTWVDYLHSYT